MKSCTYPHYLITKQKKNYSKVFILPKLNNRFMKFIYLLILFLLSFSKLNSQVFYWKINDEFQTEKIECIPVTSTKLKLKN